MSEQAAAPVTIIPSLTLQTLRDQLQQAGYRVETATDPIANLPYLRSATGGVAFDIRPGNPLAAGSDSFVDVAFVAVLQVAGELPLDVVNRWNAARRFGRLQLSPPFLVFCLDISVVGGVTPAYLRAQIALWDRLVQELIPFLRNALAETATQNNKTVPPASGAPRANAGASAAA